MILNLVRLIARHRAAKRQERQAFRAVMERLVAKLEQPEWERHGHYRRRRPSTARIIAEQAWSRRGFTPEPEDDT